MALLLAACLTISAPAAQEPTLSAALAHASTYVSNFQQQLATIVAEEIYVQEIKYQRGVQGKDLPAHDSGW